MKRFYMILAAIAALTLTAQAQIWDNIEVGDWENPTTYNGSYFDMAPTNFYVAHTGAQMLFTPDILANMNGKQNVVIKAMYFMFHDESFEEISRVVKIYFYETDATEFGLNEQGAKQFFPLGEQVWEEEPIYDLSWNYGEDYSIRFPMNYQFTPGKSLLVTMVFDAQDDDNCTSGSDYAPFYTSGIRGKAMTYTNNWTSFVDYAEGDNFPDVTTGCGTNVDLPLTRIQYTYDEAPVVDQVGAPTFEGYTVDGIHGYGVHIYPTTEGSNIMYRVFIDEDGEWVLVTDWTEYMGADMEIWMTEADAKYRVEAYAYIGEVESQQVAYEFVVQPYTGINEMNAGKAVAGVRYFNVAGQEMAQPEGLTIVVTTYTDGTTSASKVVK